MQGTLILDTGTFSRKAAAAGATVALTAVIAAVVTGVMKRLSPIGGMPLQIAAAVVTLILVFVLYPILSGALNRRRPPKRREVAWRLDLEALTLDGEEIPLASIRRLHRWTEGEHLTVNIETTGKNRLLVAAAVPEGTALLQAFADAVDQALPRT